MARKTHTEAQARYDKVNRRVYGFRLHNEIDGDIIAKLASVDSMQGYIKQLIREDLKEPTAQKNSTCIDIRKEIEKLSEFSNEIKDSGGRFFTSGSEKALHMHTLNKAIEYIETMYNQIESTKSCKLCANNEKCDPNAPEGTEEQETFAKCNGSLKENWKWLSAHVLDRPGSVPVPLSSETIEVLKEKAVNAGISVPDLISSIVNECILRDMRKDIKSAPDSVPDSVPDSYDIEHGYTCEHCANNVGEADNDMIICHDDGQEKHKNDTCDYWQ